MEKFAEVLSRFWDKAKKTFTRAISWSVKNYKIAAPTAIVILAAAVLLVVFGFRGKEGKEALAQNTSESQQSETSAGAVVVPEMPLEENAHEDVNQFVSTYYQALADGNMDVVASMRSYTDETEKIKIVRKSQYIENYQNIVCYTKPGPMDNSFIAYVYYEVKFVDIDTLAPGLNSLYLYHDDVGTMKIGVGEMDDNIAEYLKKASAQDNVVALFNQVEVKYNEAVEADEKLGTFLAELPTRLKTEVGEELAAAEAARASVSENQAAEPESQTEPEQPAAEPEPQEQTVTVEMVKAKTTVNVRSSDSETADKVGKAEAGNTYKRLEERANGWSKIDFDGREAFVKTEFLEIASTSTEPASSEQSQQQEQITDNELGTPPEGKIIIKETVNVRKSANESGEKLGVAYRGDQFELLMKQADGWTKIKYKGQTAYVKSEFVQ